MPSAEELVELCRARGARITPQRLAIFASLWEHSGHPSVEEVHQSALRRCPTVTLATVYNTLQLLTDLGVIREVIVDELRRRYDTNNEPHHHAVCRRCRRILDIDAGAAATPAAELSAFDFLVESAHVEFTGVCGDCRRVAD